MRVPGAAYEVFLKISGYRSKVSVSGINRSTLCGYPLQ
jgi:hypothetical protein